MDNCEHYTDRECHAAGCPHNCTPRTCSDHPDVIWAQDGTIITKAG